MVGAGRAAAELRNIGKLIPEKDISKVIECLIELADDTNGIVRLRAAQSLWALRELTTLEKRNLIEDSPLKLTDDPELDTRVTLSELLGYPVPPWPRRKKRSGSRLRRRTRSS
jgi:hypothetical protein